MRVVRFGDVLDGFERCELRSVDHMLCWDVREHGRQRDERSNVHRVRERQLQHERERRELLGVDHLRGRHVRERQWDGHERPRVHGVCEWLRRDHKRWKLHAVDHLRGRQRATGRRYEHDGRAVRELSLRDVLRGRRYSKG